MPRRRIGPDDWLGLVPEVERLGPDLIARLGDEAEAAIIRGRIRALIRDGDAGAWMDLLRDLGLRVADGAAADDQAASSLAEILRDQYRLAPGVLEPTARDQEMSRLLEEMTAR